MSEDQPTVCRSEVYHSPGGRRLVAGGPAEARGDPQPTAKSEGVPRKQANEQSWAELAELYPPPARPAPAPAPNRWLRVSITRMTTAAAIWMC